MDGWTQQIDIVALVCGALFLFAGFALYRFTLTLAGVIIGGGLGLVVAQHIIPQLGDPTTLQQWLVRLGSIVMGILLGIILVRFVNWLLLFLVGGAISAGIFFLVASALKDSDSDNIALLAFGTPVAGVIGGLLTALLSRYLIAIATAIIGTTLIMQATAWPWDGLPAIPLFLLGLVVQLGIARPWRKRDSKKDEE